MLFVRKAQLYKLKILFAAVTLSIAGVTISNLTRYSLTQALLPQDDLRSLASLSKTQIPQHSTLSYRPQVGHQYHYHYSRKLEFQGSQQHLAPISYDGDLTLQILKTNTRGFEAIIRDRVSLRILYDYDSHSLQIFQPPSPTPDETQSIALLKDLIALFFYSHDTDTIGHYEARFILSYSDTDTQSWKKTKLAYTPHPTHPIPEILSSEHELKLDLKLGMPNTVAGFETQRYSEASLYTQSSYAMTLREVSKGVLLSHPEISSLTKPTTLDITQDSALFASTGSTTHTEWSHLSQRLMQIENLHADERLRTLGDLIKSLKTEKTSIIGLTDFLRSHNVMKKGADSQLFKTVTGALASLGTPAAQQAVLELYQDPDLPVSGKGSILSALTTMQAPQTPETQETLLELARDGSNKSLTQGARFAASSHYSPAVAELIHEVKLSEIDTAIDMMGNSGSAVFIPELKQMMNDESDARIHAKAVFALRLMPTGDADLILSQSLRDPLVPVRAAAIEAILSRSWSEEYTEGIEHCKTYETNEYIKTQCLKVKRESL